jgi:hypothetical protein
MARHDRPAKHPDTAAEQSSPQTGQTDGGGGPDGHGDGGHHQRTMYLRFGAMILTSTVVMFLLTYTNVYSADHLAWSEERVYMALLMGSAMGIVMLAFMWGMYKNRTVNAAIVVGALLLGSLALFLSRSQTFVEDRAYMNGMIPHHSIAILTSERANFEDVRVQKLADEIIEAQRREIAEMRWLVDDIAENGPATSQEEAEQRPVPELGP